MIGVVDPALAPLRFPGCYIFPPARLAHLKNLPRRFR